MARNGETIPKGTYGESRVIGRGDVEQAEVLAADQVLVGTNRTRRRYNQRLRDLKGFQGPLPASGDKVVALRNDPTKGLLNGSLIESSQLERQIGFRILLGQQTLQVSTGDDPPDVAELRKTSFSVEEPQLVAVPLLEVILRHLPTLFDRIVEIEISVSHDSIIQAGRVRIDDGKSSHVGI